MTLVIVFHGSNRHAHFVHMVLCLEFDSKLGSLACAMYLQSEVTRRKEQMEAMKAADMEAKEGLLLRHEITHNDHPLSLGSSSVWHQFFQVSLLLGHPQKRILKSEPALLFPSILCPLS
jgi:hypothetical protein